ncbi:hypothetical protein BT96DRAFT_752750, partial [Gymnopus androsaceus JB14]
ANVSSTCPLDLVLWHCRLGHIDYQTIKTMHRKKLVKGMTIAVSSKPEPICEPCLAGKQHWHNIPCGPSLQKTRVIALIHTDLKGPMPIMSKEGYR